MSTFSVDLNRFSTYGLSMLSPEQSRAARGWLEWSQEDLAQRANLSLSTVRDFEKGRRTPIKNNIDAMERALSASGIEFVAYPDGRPAGIIVKNIAERPMLITTDNA